MNFEKDVMGVQNRRVPGPVSNVKLSPHRPHTVIGTRVPVGPVPFRPFSWGYGFFIQSLPNAEERSIVSIEYAHIVYIFGIGDCLCLRNLRWKV